MGSRLELKSIASNESLHGQLTVFDGNGDGDLDATEWRGVESLIFPEIRDEAYAIPRDSFRTYARFLPFYARVIAERPGLEPEEALAMDSLIRSESGRFVPFRWRGENFWVEDFATVWDEGSPPRLAYRLRLAAFSDKGGITRYEFVIGDELSLTIGHQEQGAFVPDASHDEDDLFADPAAGASPQMLYAALVRLYDSCQDEILSQYVPESPLPSGGDETSVQKAVERLSVICENRGFTGEGFIEGRDAPLPAADAEAKLLTLAEDAAFLQVPESFLMIPVSGDPAEKEIAGLQSLLAHVPPQLLAALTRPNPDFAAHPFSITVSDDESYFAYYPELNAIHVNPQSLRSPGTRSLASFLHEVAHAVADSLIYGVEEERRLRLDEAVENGAWPDALPLAAGVIGDKLAGHYRLELADVPESVPATEYARLAADPRPWSEKSVSLYSGENAGEFLAECLLAYFNCGAPPGREPLRGSEYPKNFVTRAELREKLPLMAEACDRFFDENSETYLSVGAFLPC